MVSVRVQIPVKAEPQESGIWISINIQQKESGQTVDLGWNSIEKEGNVTIWANQVLRYYGYFISIVLEHLRTLPLGEEKVEDSPPLGSGRTWMVSGWFQEMYGSVR